jgi:hypothetical protein
VFSKLRSGLSLGLALAGLFLTPLAARADEDFHPTRDGGNFGLGVELGDPGNWGITGKLWIDSVNALQPAVKFNDGGPAILQLDYLWHNFDIIRLDRGGLPFYIGLGVNAVLTDSVQFAGRIPVGISYIFDKRNFPVDIYFQLVPTLWINSSIVTLDLYPEIGAHLYL